MFLSGFVCSKKTYRFFDKSHGLIFLEKMSIFSNLLEVQFCGLKSIFFIQDIKKCFFLAFFAQKKHMRKRSIFWQKTWTNPFAKCRFFFTLLELNFSGLKSILFYPEYQKMFLSGVFAKKNIWENSRFFEKNNWLTLLQNVDFFYLVRTSLLRSKKHYFLTGISKNASSWLYG